MAAAVLPSKGCNCKGGESSCERERYRQKSVGLPLSADRLSVLFQCSHRNGFQGSFVNSCAAWSSVENPVTAAQFFILFTRPYRSFDELPLSS
jgi:hypothetical protein